MPTAHARTEILLGTQAVAHLRAKHVLIAGIGGVGAYVAENLARAGIGQLTLLDSDVVTLSNLNRQLPALHSTIGEKKTAVMQTRIADIDPMIQVNVIDAFMSSDKAEATVLSGEYDWIADCIDSIACKAQLVIEAQKHAIPIISAMGAGNCLDVARVKVARLDKTTGCPLAREMRRRLREQRGNLKYPVIFTDEPRRAPVVAESSDGSYRQKATNGTIAYLPAIFGVLLAGEIVKRLIEELKTSN